MMNKSQSQQLSNEDDWDEQRQDQPGSSTPKDTALVKCDEPGEQVLIPFPEYQKPTYFPALTARTSLFSASRVSRQLAEDAPSVKVELSGQNGYKLTAWGPRLNMHDKLVWETAVQVALEQQHGMGSRFAISLRDFANRMDWHSHGGTALDWIWQSLRRLYFVRLEFVLPNGSKGGGSILSTAIEDGNRFMIRLNPDFCGPLFHKENLFLIKTKRRATLTGQLARWLHDYFSTHRGFDAEISAASSKEDAAPREMRISLKKLREISGYSAERCRFAKDLEDAMKELKEKAPELISNSSISREGKSSDSWILHLTRGEERPAYLMPELSRSEMELPPPSTNKPSRRNSSNQKGGVVL